MFEDSMMINSSYSCYMLIVGQDVDMIQNLKRELSKTFDMKDLGNPKRILGMEILRDRKACKLWLLREKKIEQMLERFNMKNSKPVFTPLVVHFKLSKRLCPSTRKEKRNASHSILIGSWKSDVCYGVYTSKYISCNWSCKHIPMKSW